MKEIEQIRKYLNVALEKKYWIIIPVLLAVLGGLHYALSAQPMFKGKTLILVIPQKVPEGYVKSIVHLTMEERLRTIQQQVMSRTNLEAILAEHDLFNEPERGRLLTEEKIDLFRKRIGTEVVRDSAFSINFTYEDPKKAMDVTNKLASNFISENLKIREEQALGTSRFLKDELDAMRKRLEEKEETIKQYTQQHLGAMPEDLSSNLSTLQRLQIRLDQLNTNLLAAEERRLVVQQQMASQKMMEDQMAGLFLQDSGSGGGLGYGESAALSSLRSELAKLELRYTENHPDVVRLKTMIARLEKQEAESAPEALVDETDGEAPVSMAGFSMTDMLKPQLQQIANEIAGLRQEIQKVRAQAELYEQRVEDAPKRTQEMILLTRDYETIKRQYDTMAIRKLEADMAVSMEKQQQGEQFRLLDPAKLPEKPVSPNVSRILLLSLALGLCLGGGVALVAETLDTSYRNPDEAEGELHLPILGSIAYRYTKREQQMQKLKGVLKASSVAAAFAASALALMIHSKGAEKTFDFIRNLLPWHM
jgi:polysaccharide chain length determinant protein (PEP-CTERM system associated)